MIDTRQNRHSESSIHVFNLSNEAKPLLARDDSAYLTPLPEGPHNLGHP